MSDSENYNFVLKVETDTTTPSVICVLVLYDIDRDVTHTFSDQPGNDHTIQQGAICAQMADGIIVHSDFAVRAIKRVCDVALDPSKVFDALDYARKTYGAKLDGTGHGLTAWAQRLGIRRRAFMGSKLWTDEAQTHCISDAKIIAKLFNILRECAA
jgi:hypothetical protein